MHYPQLQNERSIEFSEALKRITILIKNQRIDPTKYGYLCDGKPILEKLNWFRNRLIHRGTFVLPTGALDKFIVRLLLPIVNLSIQLPEVSEKEIYWKYQHPLSCGIDPIHELVMNSQSEPLELKKIAYLKELGRAAYHDPIQKRGIPIDRGERERAEAAAKSDLDRREACVYDIRKCPVCGCDSLVRFFDIEISDHYFEGRSELKITNVKCYCCSFEILAELGNASDLNLSIEDDWFFEEDVIINPSGNET